MNIYFRRFLFTLLGGLTSFTIVLSLARNQRSKESLEKAHVNNRAEIRVESVENLRIIDMNGFQQTTARELGIVGRPYDNKALSAADKEEFLSPQDNVWFKKNESALTLDDGRRVQLYPPAPLVEKTDR